jgi:hypothetical protein
MSRSGARAQIVKRISPVWQEKINLTARLERPLTTLKKMDRIGQVLENVAGNDKIEPFPGQIEFAELAAIVNRIDGLQPGSIDADIVILETQGLRIGMIDNKRLEPVSFW